MEPKEYRLSQDVLIFLIENQDSFLVGMSGTAADEKTVKEVQSGVQTRQPNLPMTPQSGMGRSSSNASAGPDSLRKFGGIRRNVSVSSKGSKNSTHIPSPAGSTPGSPHTIGSGVHRSNTVPSKKSPGIPSRFSRPLQVTESPESTFIPTNHLGAGAQSLSTGGQPGHGAEGRSLSVKSSITPTAKTPIGPDVVEDTKAEDPKGGDIPKTEGLTLQPPTSGFSKPESGTPTKERKLSGLFAKSPTSDSERKDGRQPNKLKKKRPESTNPSAQSSMHSLHGPPDSPPGQAFYTPMPTPGANSQYQADPMTATASELQHPPLLSNISATPTSEVPPNSTAGQDVSHLTSQVQSPPLKPTKSPPPSIRSRTSATDVTSQSEAEHIEDPASKERKKEKKHRWRFSSSAKKNGEHPVPVPKPSEISPNAIAEQSTTSIASIGKPIPNQGFPANAPVDKPYEAMVLVPPVQPSSPAATSSKDRENHYKEKEKEMSPDANEKRGPIGWFKGKIAKTKEDRKERAK
ncbi:MAG: hypothetical protein Q9201_004772, partial [Fulgogasparrea decipioides]